MYKIEDVDTSNFAFDPKDKYFMKKLERAVPLFETASIEHKKRYATYLALMYDKNSPLVKEIPDYFIRKYECALIAGYTIDNKGKFGNVESTIIGSDEEAAKLLSYFISYFSDSVWFKYQMLLELRAQIQVEIRVGELKFSDKKDLYRHIDGLSGEIDECERLMFKSGDYDEIITIKNALYARAESNRIQQLRPENVAEDLDGAGANPYGDYEVSPKDIKFIGDSKEVAEKKLKSNGK